MRLRVLSISCLMLVASSSASASAEDARQECVAASTAGQSLRDEGKLVAARGRFAVCARDECSAVVRRYCAEWLAGVDARVASVVVRATTSYGDAVADARVSVDGRPIVLGAPTLLDPGEHAVRAERAGAAPIDAHVIVSEGEKGRVVEVRFPADPPKPAPYVRATPEAQHLLPLSTSIFAVVGVTGLAGFAYFGVDTENKVSEMRSTCAPHCSASDVDAAKREARTANVFLGVGLVALGVAAYTFFTREKPDAGADAPKTALDLRATPGGAIGTFGARF